MFEKYDVFDDCYYYFLQVTVSLKLCQRLPSSEELSSYCCDRTWFTWCRLLWKYLLLCLQQSSEFDVDELPTKASQLTSTYQVND